MAGTSAYDAVIVGGGHNGLVAAAYLTRMGAHVVVLEARHRTGGAADTSAPFSDLPDVRVTTLSYVMSLMPQTVRDLRLERFGHHAVREIVKDRRRGRSRWWRSR